MTATQFRKVLQDLTSAEKRRLVIRVEADGWQRGLDKSRELISKMEREMRIQKLELAVKRLNLRRDWV